MSRRFYADEYRFSLVINGRKELVLLAEVPFHERKDVKNPLFHDWDYESLSPIWVTTKEFEGQINIWTFAKKLKENLFGFLKQYIVWFFYFHPNSQRKGILYRRIFNSVRKELEKDWNIQLVEDTYYYFLRKTPY